MSSAALAMSISFRIRKKSRWIMLKKTPKIICCHELKDSLKFVLWNFWDRQLFINSKAPRRNPRAINSAINTSCGKESEAFQRSVNCLFPFSSLCQQGVVAYNLSKNHWYLEGNSSVNKVNYLLRSFSNTLTTASKILKGRLLSLEPL